MFMAIIILQELKKIGWCYFLRFQLTEDDHVCINWSLHGLENFQGSRKRPICLPITVSMLQALRASLDLGDPFEVCIWAMVTCAGMRVSARCQYRVQPLTNLNISSGKMSLSG